YRGAARKTRRRTSDTSGCSRRPTGRGVEKTSPPPAPLSEAAEGGGDGSAIHQKRTSPLNRFVSRHPPLPLGDGAGGVRLIAVSRAASSTRRSQSPSSGPNGNSIPRELLTTAPNPSARNAAFTSAAEPPCAPKPGRRNTTSGSAARSSASSAGYVAPTTAPTSPRPSAPRFSRDHAATVSPTMRYSGLPSTRKS